MAFKRDKVIRSAEKYVSKGKLEAAIKQYRKVLEEQPNDVNTLNRVGDLYSRLGRDQEAIRFFKQIAEQYTSDGFFVKAIAINKKIIRLDPSHLEVYEKLAELYAKQGLMNEARSQYQVLVDNYLKQDDHAAAINVYQKLTELEPENPSHHLKLAELYEERDLYDEALKAYRTIAELMLEHERGEEAAKVYERAIEIHSEDLGFITDAVLGLKDGGFNGPAARILARAVELNPQAERIRRLAGLEGTEPGEAVETEAPAEPEMGLEVEPEEELEPSPEGALDIGPALEEDEEEGVFVLDLDEEEIPEGLVSPPEDMEETGSAFQTEEPATEDLSAVEAEEEGLELPEAGEGLGSPDLEEEFELEIELEPGAELEDEAEAEAELEPPEEIEWSFEAEAEAPSEPVEAPAEEAVPEEERARPEDLLAEAEVFAKYGLREKALERLGQVIEITPDHLDAQQKRLDLVLEGDDEDRIREAATSYRRVALAEGEERAWREMEAALDAAGIKLPEVLPSEEVVPEPAEPGAEPPTPTEVEPSLEEVEPSLDEVEPEAPRPGRKPADIDRALEELTSEILEPKRPKRPPKPPPEEQIEEPEPAAEVGPVEPVEEEAAEAPAAEEVEEVAEEEEKEEIPVAPPERVELVDEGELETELPGIQLPDERVDAPAADLLDESGMDWLDEETPVPEGVPGEEVLFDDEEEFFDLAAELEEELTQEEARMEGEGEVIGQPEEPSLEEIVDGFKKGVAENLSDEDFATHYNLGIAYREMGLLDEAIGEFQVASKSEEFLVDCCSMLGLSFLEKGLPELAVKWFQKGLEAPGLAEETRLSFLYDMGNVYLTLDDEESARDAFTEIYGADNQFRDVGEKLEELKG